MNALDYRIGLLVDASRPQTVPVAAPPFRALCWKMHNAAFYSLMVGRIELARISQRSTTGGWFYAFNFVQSDESGGGSCATQAEAMSLCEDQARCVLMETP